VYREGFQTAAIEQSESDLTSGTKANGQVWGFFAPSKASINDLDGVKAALE
jgi:hypothetical protein